MNELLNRRTLLGGAAGGLSLALGGMAPEAMAATAMPWIRRVVHFYTGPDGQSRGEEIPFAAPKPGDTDRLLRRKAERVTLSNMAPNFRYPFHNANYPTLLIPIFGTIVVILADGKEFSVGHGEMIYAEDCTGKGHISGAGPEGCFSVQVQLVKSRCPDQGSTDFKTFWIDPD